MKKLYYFAYGSNLLSARLKWRVGFVQKYQNHRLYGYKLVFRTGWYQSCFANIVPGLPTDFVEGVLYNINDEQLQVLDGCEACYLKEFFIAPDGNVAAVYVGKAECTAKKSARPDLDYINVILDGCIEHTLTETYKQVFDYKVKNYDLRKGNKHKQFF